MRPPPPPPPPPLPWETLRFPRGASCAPPPPPPWETLRFPRGTFCAPRLTWETLRFPRGASCAPPPPPPPFLGKHGGFPGEHDALPPIDRDLGLYRSQLGNVMPLPCDWPRTVPVATPQAGTCPCGFEGHDPGGPPSGKSKSK